MATKSFKLFNWYGSSPQAVTEVFLSLFLLISGTLLLGCGETALHCEMQIYTYAQHRLNM